MSTQRRRMQMILLPVAVLLLAGLGAVAIVKSKPKVESRRPERIPPLVRVAEVTPRDLNLSVEAQGTVSPRTESQLVPEVSGKLTWVAPSFVVGGVFRKGQTLLRVDPADYRQAVTTAEAEVARARLHLAQVEAEAEVARREWRELGAGNATPLTLREPQLADARAALAASEARLDRAKRDLARTEIRAPYAGQVRHKSVDIGQVVMAGTPIGTIYAVDYAEIRLPLRDSELAYLDLPFGYPGDDAETLGPRVVLSADFAGERHSWEGRIVRTEGEVDPSTRMVHLVARVKDPYSPQNGGAPLAAGLFVQARIDGRAARGIVVLPRAALRGENRVYVVDDEERLRFREVDLLRVTKGDVLIRGGLASGERVCLSPIDAATDGMQVRVRVEDGSTEASES